MLLYIYILKGKAPCRRPLIIDMGRFLRIALISFGLYLIGTRVRDQTGSQDCFVILLIGCDAFFSPFFSGITYLEYGIR